MHSFFYFCDKAIFLKPYFSSDFSLGILGGGQLGKMLLHETHKWDIQTKVLDPSPVAPCANMTKNFTVGSFIDYQTVYDFGKQVDVLTVEIEHINIKALYDLEKEGVKVYPQAQVLDTVQDKIKQKEFFKKHQIPTTAFKTFQNKAALEKETFDFPVVWKSARLGYDGMGVKVLKNVADINTLPDVPCVIESFLVIDKELAVIIARNVAGDIKSFPSVDMDFHPEANQVEYIFAPASIDKASDKKVQDLATLVSKAFGHVGLLAIEFILDKSGALYVNEVAPRPHNSGHFSIEAAYTSQFEQHLRAILGLPLGNTKLKMPAVMVNLVGEEFYTGEVLYQNMEEILSWDGVTPHIYGKKMTRAFRKMGHVTIVNPSLEKAKETAKKVKNTLRVIGTEQLSCD